MHWLLGSSGALSIRTGYRNLCSVKHHRAESGDARPAFISLGLINSGIDGLAPKGVHAFSYTIIQSHSVAPIWIILTKGQFPCQTRLTRINALPAVRLILDILNSASTLFFLRIPPSSGGMPSLRAMRIGTSRSCALF
ncbi:hypothetical protein [Pontivivens nitratireducens]|uniref:Uncharacterized protein n=1 Tax=Pontivivens nitratireducens TaxID=2758038 RepID=A0A6G7VIN2_9RHOB|nr:hypothetical protein [Pontibrevibacter nitratireducens]QIK39750.1 hypothetical protein G8E03_02595 [Pontibrevibacter nitratireducens]